MYFVHVNRRLLAEIPREARRQQWKKKAFLVKKEEFCFKFLPWYEIPPENIFVDNDFFLFFYFFLFH